MQRSRRIRSLGRPASPATPAGSLPADMQMSHGSGTGPDLITGLQAEVKASRESLGA